MWLIGFATEVESGEVDLMEVPKKKVTQLRSPSPRKTSPARLSHHDLARAEKHRQNASTYLSGRIERLVEIKNQLQR